MDKNIYDIEYIIIKSEIRTISKTLIYIKDNDVIFDSKNIELNLEILNAAKFIEALSKLFKKKEIIRDNIVSLYNIKAPVKISFYNEKPIYDLMSIGTKSGCLILMLENPFAICVDLRIAKIMCKDLKEALNGQNTENQGT